MASSLGLGAGHGLVGKHRDNEKEYSEAVDGMCPVDVLLALTMAGQAA